MNDSTRQIVCAIAILLSLIGLMYVFQLQEESGSSPRAVVVVIR